MQIEQTFRDVIKQEFQYRKARNPQYSLRSFAGHLGMGSGALSELLNGKRQISHNRARLICEKLNLNDEEKKQVLSHVKTTNQIHRDENEVKTTLLNQAVFEVVSSPLCTAILGLSDLDGFKLTTAYIAKKLGEKTEKVQEALALMKRVGLIEDNKIVSDFFVSTDGIPSRMIKNFHHTMLERAQESIETQSLEKRDVSGITFSFDSKDLPKIKKEIQSFQNKLIKKYMKDKKDALYQLEMALFSLLKDDE